MWVIVAVAVWLAALILALGLCMAAKRGDQALGYEPLELPDGDPASHTRCGMQGGAHSPRQAPLPPSPRVPEISLTATIERWVLMAGAKRQLSVGELRRRVRLGSEAVYRIRAIDGKHTLVEVVRAPGLAAGQQFRLSRRDVALMERVATGDS